MEKNEVREGEDKGYGMREFVDYHLNFGGQGRPH